MDLERLSKALEWNDKLAATWPMEEGGPLEYLTEAARAYRDLLANGERVEPDDWPIVSKLSEAQVRKLESHRQDRGLDGWMNEEPHWLLQRLRDEVEELATNPTWEEAADVANFAAMFVDVSRLLDDYPKEAENDS